MPQQSHTSVRKPKPSAAPIAKPRLKPAPEVIAALRSKGKAREAGPITGFNPFQLPKFPACAIPPDRKLAMDQQLGATLAMDDALFNAQTWGGLQGSIGYNVQFLGYPELAVLSQRVEYRQITSTLAREATREWIEFSIAGDVEDAEEKKELRDRIKIVEDKLGKLGAQQAFCQCSEYDGFFGRGHLYIDTGDTDNPAELDKPLKADKAKLPKGVLRLKPIEPVWVYPINYESTNPLREDWYNPTIWYVMGQNVHASRLLRFVGHEVADLLKPSYSFGGLSLTQLCKPYVDIWLQTRRDVGELINSYAIVSLATDLAASLQPAAGNMTFDQRMDLFNLTRNNCGLLVLDKGQEELTVDTISLAGLHELQSQAQEHMCLSGDAHIETARGSVRIDSLKGNDFVLTRKGYAPIEWCGVTGYTNELIQIETDHSCLRVTPSHPIYSSRTNAFVPARNVSLMDRLLVVPMLPTSMALPFFGARVGGEKLKPGTTATSKAGECSIERFGRRIAVQSLKTLISTIETKIKAIISSITSFLPLIPSTCPSTLALAASDSPGLLSVTHVRALNVACNSLQSGRIEQNIAEKFARAARIPESINILSIRLNQVRGQPVYNLKVKNGHEPEFYANGILVHNCSASGEPAIELLGVQPAGFNASSEGEINAWERRVMAYQQRVLMGPLHILIDYIQAAEFGKPDPRITWKFKKLRTITPKEQYEIQRYKAEMYKALVEGGIISPEEGRTALADDPDSGFNGIEADDIPEQNEGVEEFDLTGQEEGPENRETFTNQPAPAPEAE